MAFLFVLAFVFKKSPLGLLAGLGAFAAVLLLVFKDPILGLVASIQLSANKMLKPGDWIEAPKHNANGTVIDISLTTVKVQNGDLSVSAIPTYSLVSDSFLNCSGMEESHGRRIKRSINIDMKSVTFYDFAMLEKFGHFVLIWKYIEEKGNEISEHNQTLGINNDIVPNGRRQTNLGIFRKYLEAYLKDQPVINTDMTFMIRYLQPTETGLPIEIYIFSKEKKLSVYEAVQSDIFDHIIADIPEFGLRVFQSPSGSDIQDLAEKLSVRIS